MSAGWTASRSKWQEDDKGKAPAPASPSPATPDAGISRSGSSDSGGKRASWKAGNRADSWIKGEGAAAAAAAAAPPGSPAPPPVVRDADKPLSQLLSGEELEALCAALPKLELHAHLSGTVQESTLRALLLAQGGDPTTSRFCLDAVSVSDSLKETWEQTVEAFATIRRLTAQDVSVLQRIVMEAVELYAKDGCVYYEMRTGLKPLPDRRNFLSLLVAALKQAEGKHRCTVRLLVSVDRGASLEEAKETIDAAIEAYEAQNRMHQCIVGVEMGGNPLKGDWKELEPHFERARAAGLKVSLHFAENQGAEEEHKQILAFKPERVGHAVFMSEAIASQLVNTGIPVEVCMTCHEAFYKVPFKSNVFGSLKHANHPAVLCCDNACLLRTSLSREYAVCLQTFALSAREVNDMILRGVEAIFADDKTKARVAESCRTRLAAVFPILYGLPAEPKGGASGGGKPPPPAPTSSLPTLAAAGAAILAAGAIVIAAKLRQ